MLTALYPRRFLELICVRSCVDSGLVVQLEGLDKKGKVIPVTSHGQPQGCETLRLPHILDNWRTDGSEVVSLSHWPPYTPRSIPGTHFC
jgi:hypothetical protein